MAMAKRAKKVVKKAAKKKVVKKAAKRGGKKVVKAAAAKKKGRAGLKLAENQLLMRHEEEAEAGELSTLTAGQMSAIEKHVEKHVGAFEKVVHEIMSERVHLDLIPVGPSKKRPFHAYVTMGMSARAMEVPEGYEVPARAELVVVLPASWKTDEKSLARKDERWWWPIRGLKECAKLPSSYGTFLDYGHTVGSSENGETMAAGCPFVSWMVAPLLCFDAKMMELKSKKWEEGMVRFMQIIPLTEAELAYKLEHGLGGLFEKFEAAGIDPSELCDVGRGSVV